MLTACSSNDDNMDPVVPQPEPEPQPMVTDSTRMECHLDDTTGSVWTKDDTVSVLSLMSVRQNKYVLSSGAGTPTGQFTLAEDNMGHGELGQLYAVTAHRYNYGTSSTDDGKMKIVTGIPAVYTLAEVAAPEGACRKPVPYWAIVSLGTGGCLTATFKGLTALLKVPVSALPSGTRAIVLCTHRFVDLGGVKHYGGDEQVLNGTFEAVLEDDTQLERNSIFIAGDSLRINLGTSYPSDENTNMFIPVVSAQYNMLYVVAVTGDTYYPYQWEGSILGSFGEDTDFSPGSMITLPQ